MSTSDSKIVVIPGINALCNFCDNLQSSSNKQKYNIYIVCQDNRQYDKEYLIPKKVLKFLVKHKINYMCYTINKLKLDYFLEDCEYHENFQYVNELLHYEPVPYDIE